jgi:hypothetical protein
LKAIATDDPVLPVESMQKNNLLKTNGWKQFWCIAKSEKKLQQITNIVECYKNVQYHKNLDNGQYVAEFGHVVTILTLQIQPPVVGLAQYSFSTR